MPELPEVETTRRGIEPHAVDRKIVALQLHERRLRWRLTNTAYARLDPRIMKRRIGLLWATFSVTLLGFSRLAAAEEAPVGADLESGGLKPPAGRACPLISPHER